MYGMITMKIFGHAMEYSGLDVVGCSGGAVKNLIGYCPPPPPLSSPIINIMSNTYTYPILPQPFTTPHSSHSGTVYITWILEGDNGTLFWL